MDFREFWVSILPEAEIKNGKEWHLLICYKALTQREKFRTRPFGRVRLGTTAAAIFFFIRPDPGKCFLIYPNILDA